MNKPIYVIASLVCVVILLIAYIFVINAKLEIYKNITPNNNQDLTSHGLNISSSQKVTLQFCKDLATLSEERYEKCVSLTTEFIKPIPTSNAEAQIPISCRIENPSNIDVFANCLTYLDENP